MTVFMAPDDVAIIREGLPRIGTATRQADAQYIRLCDSHEAWRNAAAMSHGDLMNELERLTNSEETVAKALKEVARTARNRLTEVHRLRDLCADLFDVAESAHQNSPLPPKKEHGVNP